MHPIHTQPAVQRPQGWRRLNGRRGAVLVVALAVAATAACKDSVVPNYQSSQINPLTPAGVQYELAGVFAGLRSSTGTGPDIFYFIQAMSSFSRDGGNFTNTDSRYITEWLGDGIAIPNSDFYGTVDWDNEFRIAKDAQTVIDNMPNVVPAYSTSDAANIIGIMQTMKAYAFMLIAETHDTLGVPIGGLTAPASTPAPILCTKDAWAGIVAMLDSGEADLVSATPGALPVTLPPGFGAVSGGGPPGTAGSFSAFNRALAAKAGLEYAYAVSRSPGGTPATPTTPGSPLTSALTRADSAARASFIFNAGVAEYVQTTPGDFADPLGVYHSFSGASGDVANPIQGNLTTQFVMNEAVKELAGDPRAGKLVVNSAAPGQPKYNGKVSMQMTTGNYTSPGSPIPIVRNEDLILVDAAIQLGLGNDAAALGLINVVRTKAGAGTVAPAGYVAIRNQILHEFRASNIMESGEERTILIRDYGMAAVSDTTWGSSDLHTTIIPIPTGEASARNNNTSYSCP